jgi:hypothetical protein
MDSEMSTQSECLNHRRNLEEEEDGGKRTDGGDWTAAAGRRHPDSWAP